MKEEIMIRVDDLEVRWSDDSKKYELVQWLKCDEVTKSCIVIAFFNLSPKEGYSLCTMGERFFSAGPFAFEFAKHSLQFLNTMEELKELSNED